MPQARDEAGNIWEVDAQGNPVALVQAAGAAPSRGTVYAPPADPYKQSAEARAQQDQSLQVRKFEQDRQDRTNALEAEMAAKGFMRGGGGQWVPNPNYKDPKDVKPPLSPQDRAAIAAEARNKLELLDRLENRSRNGYFATGFGAPWAGAIPGTGAYDQKADVETVGAAGALTRVMELAKENGGKNPLTPLSEADFTNIGKSVTNLDTGQSDENFQRATGTYRDIYRRALMAVEPNAPELAPPPSRLPAGVQGGVDQSRSVATGDSRFVPDDEVNQTIWSMWKSGSSLDQIRAYARTRGYNVGMPSAETLRYAKQHPDWNPFNPAGKTENTTFRQKAATTPAAGFVSGASDAVTFGLNDELFGAAALLGGGDYQKNRDEFNGRKMAVADMNPISNILGNIAGGFMLPAGAASVGSKMAPAATSRVATAVANNPIKSATTYGALYGAGQSNEDRLGGAVTGAAGGLGGGALGKYALGPIAARIARSSPAQSLAAKVEPFASKFRNGPRVMPADVTSAEQVIGSNMPEFSQVRGRLSDAADLNLPYSLADADPRLQMLAGTVARKSPDARAIAENALDPRALGQVDRFVSAIDENLAPRTNIEQRGRELLDAGRTESAPFYNMAKMQSANPDAEISAYLDTPAGRDALKRAYEIAANEGRNPNDIGLALDDAGNVIQTKTPSYETLDLVKRGLDARLNEARNPITGALDLEGNPQLGAVEGMRRGYVSRLDALNPSYPQARAAFSKWAKARDALESGKSLSAPAVLPRQVENALPRLQSNIGELRRGYATGLADTAEKVRFTGNPYDAVLGSPAAQQKLGMVFPEQAPRIQKLLGLEKDMAKTRYEVMGGSPTAMRQATDQTLGGALGEHGVNLAGGLVTGNPTWGTAARAGIQGLKFGLGKRAEQKARDVAPLLFNQNPQNLMSLMDDMIARIQADQAFTGKWKNRSGLFGAGVATPGLLNSTMGN